MVMYVRPNHLDIAYRVAPPPTARRARKVTAGEENGLDLILQGAAFFVGEVQSIPEGEVLDP